jgi:alkylation response protein AidB-like acyl-CoA dehydrogenase
VAHVALTDEQSMLVQTVARMVADHVGADHPIAPDDVTGAGAGPSGVEPDLELWQALVETGLVGIHLPESAGGAGAGAVEAALVVEQLARGPVRAPYLGTVLALDLLHRAGAADDAATVLAGRPTALTLDLALRAPAPWGTAFDGAPDGPSVGLDDDGRPVVTTSGAGLDAFDLTRRLARVADAPTAEVVGEPLDREARARWEALALALLSADLVGAMHGALHAAVAHARDRVQFGRPVGSFQAVQHLCADQLVTVESARSTTWWAAWAVDALPPDDALHAARVAKAYCSEAGRTVCEAAIQVWGGIGMTWECVAHRYLRRALLDRQILGDERVQLAAIADRQLGVAASGGRR